MQAIHAARTLHLQTCITGIHLLKRFGHTARVVEQDNWPEMFRIHMQADRDSETEQAQALGRGVAGIAKALHARKTDVVVVLGDRIEALAGALAGSLSNLPVAHIHGGELATGQQDDAIRHAISKIAHLHLPATAEAEQRLIRMGEPRWRIRRAGAPALDVLYQMTKPNRKWIEALLGMPAQDGFVIIAQHPVDPDPKVERKRMNMTLAAVAETGLPSLVIWPNTDPGHSGIVEAICAPPEGLKCKVIQSVPHETFLRALLAASAIVGNTSAGIVEAPAAGTATVNIGPRQAGRLRDTATVLESPYNRSAIIRAVYRALRLKKRLAAHRRTPYGDGKAAQRIANAIASLRCSERLLHKQNSY